MKTLQMLIVDLDGTALQGRDGLDEADVRAAARLKEAGIAVSIATGRLVGGTSWVAEALGVDGSYAVMNGSARLHTSGAMMHHRALTSDLLGEVGRLGVEASLVGFQFLSHQIRFAPEDERHRSYLNIWTPTLESAALREAHAWNRDDVLAVGFVGDHREQLDEVAAALAHPDLEVVAFDTYEGEPFLSIRMNHDDKGTAIEALAADRGLTADQVVAVGDWWNDVPMLERAGRSFAMQGSGQGALDAAGEVLSAQRGRGGAIAEIASLVWNL